MAPARAWSGPADDVPVKSRQPSSWRPQGSWAPEPDPLTLSSDIIPDFAPTAASPPPPSRQIPATPSPRRPRLLLPFTARARPNRLRLVGGKPKAAPPRWRAAGRAFFPSAPPYGPVASYIPLPARRPAERHRLALAGALRIWRKGSPVDLASDLARRPALVLSVFSSLPASLCC